MGERESICASAASLEEHAGRFGWKKGEWGCGGWRERQKMEGMEQAWTRLKTSIVKGKEYETRALKHGTADPVFKRDMERIVSGLRSARKRQLETEEETDLSDFRLSKLAKFTDGLPLSSYVGARRA